MELYMYLCMELLYMIIMELSLVGTHFGYMLKEASELSVEYNILFILERPPGYSDNQKELDYQWNTIYYLYWKDHPGIVRLQP